MATKSTKVGKGTLKSTSGRGIAAPVGVKVSGATQSKSTLKGVSGTGIAKPISLKPSGATQTKTSFDLKSAKSLSAAGIAKPVTLKPSATQAKTALDLKYAKANISARGGSGNTTGSTPSGKIKVKFDGSNLKNSFKP